MKVYILNYNLNNLEKSFQSLFKLSVTIKEFIEIYSDEGNMIIDNNNTYKLNYIDKNVIELKNYYENYDLNVDNSITIKEIITQLPPKHLAIHTKMFILKKTSQSKIKLVIVTNNDKDKSKYEDNPKYNDNKIIPTDFYFDIPEDIDLNNIFIKEEIIEFLSMLN
jgi:hypothetical protein